MIKGIIYSLALLLSLFLVVALLEYFGYFGTGVRAFLFWFYLVSAAAILCFYVVWPLTKMFRLGKVMSYDEAARIVGGHFPEVKDKLRSIIAKRLTESGSAYERIFKKELIREDLIDFLESERVLTRKKYL